MPGRADPSRLSISESAVARLEAEVTAMNTGLPPLNSFVLPGGTRGGAFAHVARTAARRAERAVLRVEGINPNVCRYLNRLSDHLFVLARVLNDNAARDVLWVPGANR
jgi:cob(I)alamin adenosyltransferase